MEVLPRRGSFLHFFLILLSEKFGIFFLPDEDKVQVNYLKASRV